MRSIVPKRQRQSSSTVPTPNTAPSRREFLRDSLVLGTGLMVGFHWGSGPLRGAAQAATATEPFAPNAFVRIAADNTVTVLSKHIEFGQGSYTGLATILAEELDADWEQVRVEAAPSDASRYQNFAFGVQGTGGSTAIPNSWQQLREAGAKARAMLVEAAADEWGVPAAGITVAQGVVSHSASGRSATFGELAGKASGLEPPETVTLKKPADFTLIGKKDLKRVDMRGKSRGESIFTIDIQLPGMLTAVLARAPRFGATVRSFDATAAKKVRGVVDVVQVPRGVAVVAKNFWAAKKGRQALEISWDESQAEKRGNAELFEEYRALVDTEGPKAIERGDAAKGLEGAAKVIEADFEYPYLAHAPMEPLDAVIQLGDDGCDIWAGSQLQTVDQMVVGGVLGLTPDKVRIHTQLGGGSFGRRATPDSDVFAEAASIAKALGTDKPIKLVWTREDDLMGGRYRPLNVHRLKAGLDADGKLVAWHHRIVGQSIVKGTAFEGALMQDGIDGTSVEGARGLPYAIPDFAVELHTTDVGIPILWWRSVGHTFNGYSTEVFFDQVAHAAGKDPVEMRLDMLEEHPRHHGVLKLAADKAGWGKPLPKGRARGVALHESFGSFVAQIVEISLGDDGLPKVERVVCAVDCGVPINPDVIAAQMESGIGFGLSAALFNEVEIVDGYVKTTNFHQYRSLRIQEMPKVETHIVPSAESPTGVGEPGVPPIAPAVANAYFQLTGKWIHRLPFINSIEHG